MHEPFAELAFLLIITSAVGVIAVHLRQPVLIAYIIVGIVVGPAGFSFVQVHDQVDLLAQIGVTVLLFLVGLKLDLQHVRHIGPVALATGLGQLGFTIIFGFLLILLLGKDWLTALYVAIALTFSSTIIIVKLLTDKRELDSLHGRIAVGFLIVQDIAVVLAMMVMSAIRGDMDAVGLSGWMIAASLIFRVSLTVLLMFFVMWYVMPSLVRFIARSQELLLIFAIAWGTSLAALGEWVGFSKEAGAFMAGFSLASTHFRDAISARLTGVRDFLLLFFFIDLGAKLDFSMLGAELWSAAALSFFVLIGNPIIVMVIMGYMGYRKRTGFLAGLTVAQISEFSIVFIAMGISLGHLEQSALGLTTLVGVVTIALSTYMILYSQRLYEYLSRWLSVFERARPYRELSMEQQRSIVNDPKIIIFGLGRHGARVLIHMCNHGVGALGVDFDPEAIRGLRQRDMPVRYGDAEDPAFLSSLPFANVDWIVTTIPEWSANQALLRALDEAGFKGRIIGLVRDDEHALALQQAGVTRVVNIFQEAAGHAADYLAREIEADEKEKS
ncbi:cation:proton antiporter [Nitrosomonas communis]|uniref:cation:proton antiporter n=1 Tax=Nitrosomonas communis TaxID=44574 RepID=UPI0026E9629E|nr:cation:proton antiporter family protein [Nitrosomonas communis]MCO6426912.1 cation:proton antiporter [Nitrosomonas communis]